MAKTAAKKKPAAAAAASKNASAKHATPQPNKKKPTKAALAKRQKAAAAAEQAAAAKEAARVLGPMAWRPSVLQQQQQRRRQQLKPKATVAEGVVPYTLPQPQDDKRDLFWPSALFFNVEYKNGILVDNKKKTEAYFEESQGYSNNNKDSDGCRTRSCLSEVEADLWGQKHAAHTAVARRFPIEVGRLLGTITLELEETLAPVATSNTKKAKTTLKNAPPPGPLPASLQNVLTKYRRKLKHSANPKHASARYEQVRKLSHKHAMDEVHRELQCLAAAWEPSSDESDSPSPLRVSAQDIKSRAHHMMQQWQAVQECPHQYQEHWHGKDGSLCHVDHNRPVDDQKALLQAPTHSAQGRVQLNVSLARRQETAQSSQAKKKNHKKTATGDAMFGTDHDKDVHHVPLVALKTWLTQGLIHTTIRDVHQDKIKSLYRGLTQVPVNAGSILEALSNLANPNAALYGVPLVVTYARMVPCLASTMDGETDDTKTTKRGKTRKRAAATSASRNNKNSKTTWKVQIGIYMHRLLPEIFDRESLHIVMSALDEGSYKIAEPLRLPPAGPPVFESAAYPRVDTSVLDMENYDANGKKHTVEIIDVDADMEGGSRDDMVLSPFSTKGLLKLLENTGCDVSEVR